MDSTRGDGSGQVCTKSPEVIGDKKKNMTWTELDSLGDHDRASSCRVSSHQCDETDRARTTEVGRERRDSLISFRPGTLSEEERASHQITTGSPNLSPLLSIPASATASGSRSAPSSYEMLSGMR